MKFEKRQTVEVDIVGLTQHEAQLIYCALYAYSNQRVLETTDENLAITKRLYQTLTDRLNA